MGTDTKSRADTPQTRESKPTRRARRAKPRRPRLQRRREPIAGAIEPPLSVGTFAVCPPHGVAEVMAIEAEEISGIHDTFYRLRIVGTGARLLIPRRKLMTSGLRQVISRETVDDVMVALRRPSRPPSGSNWSRWHRAFSHKVQSGSIFDAAEVLRDVFALKQRKSLSPAERHLFDMAAHLVINEFVVALGECPDEVQRRVMEAIER